MTSNVKVVVASEYHFTDPNDIRTQFNATRLGSDKNIEYDATSHEFIVDSPIFEAEAVGNQLGRLVHQYIEHHEEEYGVQEILEEVPKIQPIIEGDTRMTEQDHIWTKVDQLEQEHENKDPDALLIPQVTSYVDGMFQPQAMTRAFSQLKIGEVAQSTNCVVDLEVTADNGILTNRIRVVGWSKKEVDEAKRLLYALGQQYESNMQRKVFDFFEDELRLETNLRFRLPTNVIDIDLFQPNKPPLCELVKVAWDSQSRSHNIVRKKQEQIDYSRLVPTLWLKPLVFKFDKKENHPDTWIKQSAPVGHGDLSLPQRGRLEQWVDQIPEDPLDPTEVAVAEEKAVPQLGTTIRLPPQRENARPKFDEKVKDDSSDGSLSDLEPLNAGLQTQSRSRGLLLDPDSSQLRWVILAIRAAMAKAKELYKQSLSFELCFGRAYVHTVSLENNLKPRSHSTTPPKVFSGNAWPHHFRTTLEDHGASTHFSHKLTQGIMDAEFILNLKMKGGEPLLDSKSKHKRAYFEITCYDSHTQVEAVIELMDQENHSAATIEGSSEDVGRINIHHPARNWDCSWRLSARQQSFPDEQHRRFATIIEHAFVLHAPDGIQRDPELYFKSHERVSIRSVRLIRETVHRAKLGLSLVLSQVKVFEKIPMGSGMIKACALDNGTMIERHQVWWEAKLVSAELQRTLQENRKMGIGSIAKWNVKAGEAVMSTMLEVAQHLISKIDHVGYSEIGRIHDESSQNASQSASVAREMGSARSRSQAPEQEDHLL